METIVKYIAEIYAEIMGVFLNHIQYQMPDWVSPQVHVT